MAKSIMQTGKYCYNCGIETGLHLHHIYYGTGKRKISDKNGFTCWLCWRCHNAVHDGSSALGTLLKVECQMVFELEHSREEFMKIIGRNYLDD